MKKYLLLITAISGLHASVEDAEPLPRDIVLARTLMKDNQEYRTLNTSLLTNGKLLAAKLVRLTTTTETQQHILNLLPKEDKERSAKILEISTKLQALSNKPEAERTPAERNKILELSRENEELLNAIKFDQEKYTKLLAELGLYDITEDARRKDKQEKEACRDFLAQCADLLGE